MSDSTPENKREDRLAHEAANGQDTAEQPDVVLDVHQLKVDEIKLEVDSLQAHVSVLAEVLNLLRLQVGVNATLSRVSLDIKGVEAALVLRVRLEEVAEIIDRVMTTIDHNPQILGELSQLLGQATGTLVQGAGKAVQEAGQGSTSPSQSAGGNTGHPAAEPGPGGEDTADAAGDNTQGLGVDGPDRERPGAPSRTPPQPAQTDQQSRPDQPPAGTPGRSCCRSSTWGDWDPWPGSRSGSRPAAGSPRPGNAAMAWPLPGSSSVSSRSSRPSPTGSSSQCTQAAQEVAVAAVVTDRR